MLVSRILPLVVGVLWLGGIESEKSSNSVNSGSVERLWGVADTVATLGKLFNYHIPNDAFSGEVVRYEASLAGRSELPLWLHFNETSSILEGVPLEDDVGQHYITVTAIGQGNDVAKDVFSIDVMPASRDNRPTPMHSLVPNGDREEHHCDKNEESLRLVVTLDLEATSTSSLDRIRLLEGISRYLKVEKEEFQLLQRSVQNSLDANAIKAGPGNILRVQTPNTVLVWKIGCDGKLDPKEEEILNKLDLDARDGTLASILAVPVVGWHVAKHTTPVSRRVKRQQFFGYSTPIPTIYPTRPVHVPDTNWDTQEAYHGFDETEVQPSSRVVPTMASPIFMDSFYPSTRHHLHRGAHKSKGRHHNHYQKITASPFHPYHDSGLNRLRPENVYGTPFPTPDIQPTAVWGDRSRIIPDELPSPVESSEWLQPTPIVTSPVYTDVDSETTDVPPEPRLMVWKRIPKLAVVAGKYFEYVIPNDTFFNRKVGDTGSLYLKLLSDDGSDIPPNLWIQFDKWRQIIYGIPVNAFVNRWDFILEATNDMDESVREEIEISLQQHHMDRKVNHEFVLEVEHDKHVFHTLVERNIQLLTILRKLYGETRNMTDSVITVRAFTQSSFTWSNDSLLNYNGCPHHEIKRLYSKLVQGRQKVTERLLDLLTPQFTPPHAMPKVRMRWLGQCKDHSTTQPTFVTHINQRPEVINPIDFLNVTEREPFEFRIPRDTFRDYEQTDLTLELLNEFSEPLPSNFWIRYDSSRQALVGLPMTVDVGKYNLQLVAYDNGGLHVSEAFVAVVEPRPRWRRYPVEFSVELKFDYDLFQSDLKFRLLAIDKLMILYNDTTFSYITVQDVRKGSVVFTWTNNTLPDRPCPKEEIRHLMSYLQSDEETMTINLTSAFSPEFNVTGVKVMPLDVCLGEMTPTSILVSPTVKMDVVHGTTAPPKQATSVDDIYISTIVPAVVIAAMLLIAAIVACVLYRKKRKGKMSMEDSNTFVKRGAPVIFTHELEEKSDSAKAPMIMKEEKPPLPPPEYPRTSSGSSSPSTPPSQARSSGRRSKSPYHHPSHHSAAPTLESSPLYQPPPPVTANRDNRMHWPKHALTYRMPPPYVPP